MSWPAFIAVWLGLDLAFVAVMIRRAHCRPKISANGRSPRSVIEPVRNLGAEGDHSPALRVLVSKTEAPLFSHNEELAQP